MKTSHFFYVTSFAGGVLTVSIHMHGCFAPLKSVGEATPQLTVGPGVYKSKINYCINYDYSL